MHFRVTVRSATATSTWVKRYRDSIAATLDAQEFSRGMPGLVRIVVTPVASAENQRALQQQVQANRRHPLIRGVY